MQGMLKTPDTAEGAPSGAPEPFHRIVGTPWQAGTSPNPGGRPKKTEPERQAEALARERAPGAIRKLVTMIESPKTTEAGRLRAIELLLDRALGKAVARTELGPEIIINVTSLPVAQGPVPGVINSPLSGQISGTPLRLVATHPTEVIDAATLEGSS